MSEVTREELVARARELGPALGERAGKKYVYNHYDALAGVRTHAWVVPHRGRRLALEIRTRRVSMLEEFGIVAGQEIEPSEVSLRIVGSFRFHDPAPPG